MKTRIIVALVVAASVLAACGGGVSKPPRNLDNACAIIKEKKSWYKDMKRVQRQYGVSPAVLMAFIYQESKFVANARTPVQYKAGVIPMGRASSAYGFSQALDGTWNEYKRKTGRRGAKRDNFGDSVEFIGWYMNVTRERNGVSLSDARNQYFAYHDGHGGFKRGTYRKKTWLLRIGQEVQDRAVMYDLQLRRCG